MIQAVLFDLDGVIVETAELHFQAWQALGKEYGIGIDREFNEQLKGVSREQSLAKILARGGVTLSAADFEAAMARKNNHYLTLVEQLTPADILPGIPEFLAELRNHDIKIALASASKNSGLILDKLNLSQMIDFIADPGRVPSKPDPGIFLAAAVGVGVAYEHCIGIEDAAAGITAIHVAGMRAIGIGSQLQEADLVLTSTTELTLSVLQQLD